MQRISALPATHGIPEGARANPERVAILIHGAFVTPMCWRYFAPLFAARGFITLVPAWPFKERPVADQLMHADPRLASVGIPQIVQHYAGIIRKQPGPPILIGHSFGGLIVQILLDQGFGSAGIAISSVPPRGVSPVRVSVKSLRQMRSLFRKPFSWRKILPPPRAGREQQALLEARGIETHLVPESGRIFWQLFSSAARVDFRNDGRSPLLLIACGQDLSMPVETVQRNREMYRLSGARTDFALFPHLTHFSIAEPGCDTLVARCAMWLEDLLAERGPGLAEAPAQSSVSA